MASSSLLKKPVFAVSNFGTRIVIAVSPDCTVAHFKEEFESAHFSCFPELGKIRVHFVKVRSKSCFYDISELFRLKYAFEGAKGWFLHIVACRFRDQSASRKKNRRLKSNKWKKKKKKKKKKKRKIFPCFKAAFLGVPRAVYFLKRTKRNCLRKRKMRCFEEQDNVFERRRLKSKGKVLPFASEVNGDCNVQTDLGTEKECPGETVSETISVSGIINRYFSSCDEVNSKPRLSFMDLQAKSEEQLKAERANDYQIVPFGLPSPLVPRTPPQVHWQLHHESNLKSLEREAGTSVGGRVLEASKTLRLSRSNKHPVLSLSRFIDRESLNTSANTRIRRLIFEISDGDD